MSEIKVKEEQAMVDKEMISEVQELLRTAQALCEAIGTSCERLSQMLEKATENGSKIAAEDGSKNAIDNSSNKKASNDEENREKEISNILKDIGVTTNLKGYQYMRWIISRGTTNPEWLGNLTKMVYPETAEKFLTTKSRVERAIKHAIERAWETQSDNQSIKMIFKGTINHGLPTNGEFLTAVTDYLLLEKSSK